MRKTFIIASTGDRAQGLRDLLNSLYQYFQNGWEAVVVAQGYSDTVLASIHREFGRYTYIFRLTDLVGAHSAKMVGLNSMESDIWCSLDDDMVITSRTEYDKMAEILMNRREIGFISGNWGRSEEAAQKKPQIEKLIEQKLVFTGGGLMFRDDVADIIRDIPNEPYLYDDCLWAMYAYINGYDNYRYRGSIAIHKICTVGGRRTWLKQGESRVLPPSEYLRVRQGKAKDGYNQYLICQDSDLTELAKDLHKKNKIEG